MSVFQWGNMAEYSSHYNFEGINFCKNNTSGAVFQTIIADCHKRLSQNAANA
jgi:hypothetical protein